MLECFRDWPIIDLESFAKDVLRSKQAFLISKQQRIQISKVIKVSTDFHSPPKEFTILERGKKISSVSPVDPECAPQNRIKPDKKRDVLRLLRIIGVDETHPAFSFYGSSCGSSAVDGGQSSLDSSSGSSD